MTPEDGILNPAEARVLGSLVEKALTTPDYYPLTLNALVNACNQISNRDPVVSLDEQTVVRALDRLRDARLAYLFDGAQSRVPKYGHKFGEFFQLSQPEIAALAVLLLRGPQTLGEIRGRSGRMHEFATLDEAEAVLEGLGARQPRPLVARLPRQPGLKEQRYTHLLCGAPAPAAPAAAPAPEPATLAVRAENERIARLEAETAALRAEMADLRRDLAAFRAQFQ
jgi:uncharacterized protein YceH (UPF0502 family)